MLGRLEVIGPEGRLKMVDEGEGERWVIFSDEGVFLKRYEIQ